VPFDKLRAHRRGLHYAPTQTDAYTISYSQSAF